MADQNNKSSERLAKLVHSSAKIFAKYGYSKAHMSQIASDMGIAPGTLYLYVKSKKALFHFVLRNIFADDQDLTTVSVPIKISRKMSPVAALQKIIEDGHPYKPLEDAIARKKVPDIEKEFESVLRALYHILSHYRYGQAMVMHSTEDYPDLSQYFYQGIRERVVDLLGQYISARIKMNLFNPVPNPSASGRLIFETTNWFAVHKRGGPYPVYIDEKISEETVVVTLKNAFINPTAVSKKGKQAG
jgi:AcrR family transcriptional regulator